jgi:hypothetical protein
VKIRHEDKFYDDTDYIEIVGDRVVVYDTDGICNGNPGGVTKKEIAKNLKDGVWVIVREEPGYFGRMWRFFKASFNPIQGPG